MFIKFKLDKDEVDGVYLLATKSSVRGLKGNIFEMNIKMLGILDKNGIKYHTVPVENIESANMVSYKPTASTK